MTDFDDDDTNSSFFDLPEPCLTARFNESDFIDISALPADEKQKLWVYIKKHHPDLATLLGSTLISEISALFMATISIPHDIIDDYHLSNEQNSI